MNKEEALAKLKNKLPWLNKETVEVIEILVPELLESEDEKTRKEIINFLAATKYVPNSQAETINRWIDWLRHVGEKKSEADLIKATADEIAKDKDKAIAFLKAAGIMDENGKLAEMYRSDTVKSPVTEEYVNDMKKKVTVICNYLAATAKDGYCAGYCAGDLVQAMKTLIIPGNIEWTQEDEDRFDEILDYLNEWPGYYSREITWFKNLREKAKSTHLPSVWKPTEEQVKCLSIALARLKENNEMSGADVAVIESLYNDLEKM